MVDPPLRVHREDVRVLEPSGEQDFSLEALGAEHGGEFAVEHFERHRAVVLQVVGEVDRGHAAAAQLSLEAVVIGQRRG